MAVTVTVVLINTVQVDAVPEQAPDHPKNECPGAGVSVRTTEEFVENWAEQVVFPDSPQFIAPGELSTFPSVLGDTVTVNVFVAVL